MMKKSMIIVLVLIAFTLSLSAKNKTESFKFKQELVELSLSNVKVESVSFVSGNEIEVKCNDEDAIFNQDKHYLGISSPRKKAKIWLKLPENKKYHVTIEDGNFYFDKEGITLLSNDSQQIFSDGKILRITDEEEVIVYENGDIKITDSDGKIVTISEDGFITQNADIDDDDDELTGFWGKMLAAVVRVAARTAMNALGDSPEEVIKTCLNERNWRVGVNDMMNTVEQNAPDFGRKDNFREVERSFPAADIDNLSLDNFNGNISIEGTDGDQLEVKIVVSANSEEDLDNVEIEFTGKRHLKIHSKALTTEPNCAIEYEIKLPGNIALNKIVNSNGKITLSDCMGEGEFLTSNGSIKVKDFKGNADILTNNGSIEAENVSGMVSARTSNARIEIDDCPDIRKAITSNGKIILEIKNVLEDLDVSTSNADITLILSKSVNCDIQARTSNGKINLQDIKLDIINSSRNYLKAKYNDGGKLLDVETSNASIKIYNQ
ncbi:MAG: hypothetical protein P9X26_07660 [Candidatus Stygibacter frigidus]|nr:hypothetical protein [Candidatus Stygibacter frigidus]